jgi:two-component system cell cycle sensor histidine kinase/response regulator CckA
MPGRQGLPLLTGQGLPVGPGSGEPAPLPPHGRTPESEPRPQDAEAADRPLLLVVDDEEALCQLIRDVLTRRGYRVLTATSGPDGVRLFREQPDQIQLVILDMVMPGMDGRAVFEALREVDPEVRVLVSSGYMDEATAASILRRGVAGFLRKPYTLRELVEAVQAALPKTR